MREEQFQKNMAQRRKRNAMKFRRVHNRKIDRMVAKCNMIRQGTSVHKLIKNGWFAYRWREFANMDLT